MQLPTKKERDEVFPLSNHIWKKSTFRSWSTFAFIFFPYLIILFLTIYKLIKYQGDACFEQSFSNFSYFKLFITSGNKCNNTTSASETLTNVNLNKEGRSLICFSYIPQHIWYCLPAHIIPSASFQGTRNPEAKEKKKKGFWVRWKTCNISEKQIFIPTWRLF